ncbi:MAG: hypothetical protein DLM58_12940 [Pseudonocardiales bacterium]|nr:MAG: hypothetical protein DLM58_12940 [Pseudonocardiales bacterium]
MTSLAAPVFTRTATRESRSTWTRPTRYLYESPRPESNDRHAISLTFSTGYDENKRWLVEVAVEAVNRLLRLPADWDANGAAAVSELAAVTAVEWLDQLATSDTPVPHVVPLINGGVQLEWISGGQAFEVEIAPNGDVGVLGVDTAGNPIIEGEYPAPDGTVFVNDARKFLSSMFASLDRPAWQ